MKLQILYSRILEGETNAQAAEDELNRMLLDIGFDKIISLQVVEIQQDKEFKLFVITA